MNELRKKSKKQRIPKNLRWVVERKTALSILALLAKLGKASRYDLASQLDVSYATVMNYIDRFKNAGLIEEIGEVEAERGGKKTIYKPTQRALDLLSEFKSAEVARLETQPQTALPSLGFYSMPSKRKQKVNGKNKVQEVLNNMRVDIAVVVNYDDHPIPIMPISTLGKIDQVHNIFSEDVSQRILDIAIQIAKRITETPKK